MDDEMDKIAEEIEKYHLTDTKTIKQRKATILRDLIEDHDELKEYQTLLKEYRYIDEVDELRIGSYLRFFKINENDSFSLYLRNGGFLVDIQVVKQRILLLFRNRNKFFKIKMDECFLFQKNTTQENVLIQILDQIKR
jgi:hypothetical protein